MHKLRNAMNVAVTTSHGRMAPCFSGVELRVVGPQSALDEVEVIVTQAWHPLVWGRELMCRDVNTLLCAGIDQVVWAGIRGHGIEVIPNAMGNPGEVLNQWLTGCLVASQTWPIFPNVLGPDYGKRGRGRGFRGGRR